MVGAEDGAGAPVRGDAFCGVLGTVAGLLAGSDRVDVETPNPLEKQRNRFNLVTAKIENNFVGAALHLFLSWKQALFRYFTICQIAAAYLPTGWLELELKKRMSLSICRCSI